jgi:hypothetical protein
LVPLTASVTMSANLWQTQCIVKTPLLWWNVSGVRVMSPAVISSQTSCRSWRKCLLNRVQTPRYTPCMVDAPSAHIPITLPRGT